MRQPSGDPAALDGVSVQPLLDAIGTLPVDVRDYQTTLNHIVQLIVAVLADVCFLDVLDQQGAIQQIASAHSNPDQAAAMDSFARHYQPSDGEANPMMQVFISGQSLAGRLADEAHADLPAYLRRLQTAACDSFMVVALPARQRIIGTLTFGRLTTSPAYSASTMRLAEDIASRIAPIVEIGQLYEWEHRLRREAEQGAQRISLLQTVTAGFSKALTPQQVAEVAVTQGFNALSASSGSMFVLAPDGTQLDLVREIGYPSGVVDPFITLPLTVDVPITHAVKTGSSLFIRTLADYPRFAETLARRQAMTGSQSWAVLLLRVDHSIIGVLALSFREAQMFTAVEQDFMLGLANLCAQALERAQLFIAEQQAKAAAQQTQEQLAFLAEASIVLSSSLDYQTTLASLALLAVNSLADWCVLHIRDDDDTWQRHVAKASRRNTIIETWETLHDGWQAHDAMVEVQEVLRSGELLFLPDVSASGLQAPGQDGSHFHSLLALEIVSLMVVPLVVRGRIIGTISLATTDPQHVYTTADLELAEELARRATIAVDNARLYWYARQSEQIKEESLALLDTLFNHAPVGLAFWDQNLRYVRVNATLAMLNHQPIAAHIGHTVDDVLPTVAPAINARLRQVLDTGRPIVDVEVSTYPSIPFTQGRSWLSSYYPVPGANGAIIGVGCVVTDISQRKRTENQLRFLAEISTVLASSLEYETTLQNVAQLAVPALADCCSVDILEDDGLLHPLAWASSPYLLSDTAQQDYAAAIGQSQQSLLYRVVHTGEPLSITAMPSDHALFAEATPLAQWLQAQQCCGLLGLPLLVREQVIGVMVFVLLHHERSYTDADVALATELTRRAAVAIDNARLYADAQRALQVRDQFLSIASHELKTPITTLMGYTQLLIRRARHNQHTEPRDLRAIQSINDQAGRLHRLILSLLDLSRLQVGQLSIEQAPLDLALLVQRIVAEQEPMLERYTISLVLPATAMIAGDELRLEQVVVNLVQNAVKYSPGGGPIIVQLECTDSSAVLSVTDQGIGIPDDAIPQLFGRFYRASNATIPRISGLGLGLYIVREIVTLHSGTVVVQSVEGQGSTFTVFLPLL